MNDFYGLEATLHLFKALFFELIYCKKKNYRIQLLDIYIHTLI